MVDHALGGYDGFPEGGDSLFHHYVQAAVAVHVYVKVKVFKGEAAEIQDVLSKWEGQAETSVVVCHRIGTAVAACYQHSCYGLA